MTMPKEWNPAEVALLLWAEWLIIDTVLMDRYDEPFPDDDIQREYEYMQLEMRNLVS